MPKDIIDYSNTIIYKIVCNDQSVTDIYMSDILLTLLKENINIRYYLMAVLN